jgi:predicted ATPase
MSIEKLTLENFTVFEKAELEFVPGLNVFIGANGTGKTHAMKIMYAVCQALRMQGADEPARKGKFGSALLDKTESVFRPERDDLQRLIRHGADSKTALAVVRLNGGEVRFTLEPDKSYVPAPPFPPGLPSVYLPTRELLALYEGFIGLYSKYKTSFDSTYADACVALNTPEIVDSEGRVAQMTKPLLDAIGGPVTLEGDRFYVQTPQGKIEAHLHAEGLRKLAAVVRLVQNGSIEPGGVLFWDEPEANLNPKLTALVSELLIGLAKHGVQIFIATHDMLLSRRLSLLSEYHQGDVPIRFFSFRRADLASPVQVACGATVADLPEDAIRDAFTEHYDFEQQLFFSEGERGR